MSEHIHGYAGSADKILLTQLWQRTSRNGRVYLSGFLGKASIVCFKNEDGALPEGVDAIWSVYISPGKAAWPKGRDSGPRKMGPRVKCVDHGAIGHDGRPFDDDLPEYMR